MSKPIIEVRNLTKKYHLGAIGATSLREEVSRTWDRLRGVPHPDKQDFWALRDVSFEVQPGEVVGVIGRNGAGKSTLLKILSRITEPTSGTAILRGRVASLLEVGTGFHPELTGRENVYLNGAILGMTRAEVRQKFDEIVAFAEVEQFIDTPVKRYSSGMYVRLAFAVAAHLEPEILIVDEVLAVGDSSFQKKCIGKLHDVTTREGRTVVFVSHDMAAIANLTSRCLLLHQGHNLQIASTIDTIAKYLEFGANRSRIYEAPAPPSRDRPYVRRVEIRTSNNASVQNAGQPMEVIVRLQHDKPVVGASISFQIVNQFQQFATHAWILDSDAPYARKPGLTTLTCKIPKVHLNVGHYSLRLYFSEPPGGQMFETLDRICPFEVVRLEAASPWGWRSDACIYHEDVSWTVEMH